MYKILDVCFYSCRVFVHDFGQFFDMNSSKSKFNQRTHQNVQNIQLVKLQILIF